MAVKVNASRARCAQCGRELRTIPFNISDIIMCKECYGVDRYRRVAGAVVDRQGESAPAEEESTA